LHRVLALAIRDAAALDLAALGGQVEGDPHVERELLVLSGVSDPGLTGELERARGVSLVEAHPARRQRHAEAGGRRVLPFELDPDAARVGPAKEVARPELG